MDMYLQQFLSMQQGNFVGSLATLTLVLGVLNVKYNIGWVLN